MKKTWIVAAVLMGMSAGHAFADGPRNFRADLTGYEEVPAFSSAGHGKFEARISKDGTMVEWQLSYGDLASPIRQSHIHFGQAGVNGSISVFLCTNLGNGPAGTAVCPQSPGSISGIFVAADVIGPATQGISAGELAELIAAIRAGVAYVNVHTDVSPGGEVRGQLRPGLGSPN